MDSCDISDIIGFVNDLKNVADTMQMTTQAMIWTAETYLTSNQCNKESVHKSFYKWIKRHVEAIKTRNDEIFTLQVEGDLSSIINRIGDIYQQIGKADKEVVWAWMDHFVSRV